MAIIVEDNGIVRDPTPTGWRAAHLGEVAEVMFSSVDKRVIDGETSVELCNYTDVFYNRRIHAGLKFMAATAKPSECVRWELKRGDVLFTKDSETPDEIGIPAFVTEDMPGVLCGYHLGRARPNEKLVNGAFLAELLRSPHVSKLFAKVSNGVTRFGLTLGAANSLPILLPPLTEQRAIAAVLDSIDGAIERTDEVIAATERLRDALLHELLTRGVPGWHSAWKDVPGLGMVPASWEVVRLGDVAEVNPRRPRLTVDTGAPVSFVPMAAVGDRLSGIQEFICRPYSEVSNGFTYFEDKDVLFAKITPCVQNGKHTLAHGLQDGIGFGSTEFHVIRSGSRILPSHLFRTVTHPRNIRACVNSFTGTAGQQRVQPDAIRTIPVALPPLKEQQAVADMLDAVDAAVERARGERAGLLALKASASDALLTGRVRV